MVFLWLLGWMDQYANLPPKLDWHGKSEQLIVAEDHPWITPVEATSFRYTPTYEQTYAWLDRLVQARPELNYVTIGFSDGGYALKLVIASKDGFATPEALKRSGKPTLFAQCGIHSGEIDGKDAAMMLLRDMTAVGNKADLLDGCNLIVLPIFNPDGHERASRFNRINQRGPDVMGWRTNSRNLNLNRDYAKLDTMEVRSLVAFLHQWKPDLYLDIHVTDGIDYQYDITYGFIGSHGYSPHIAQWLQEAMVPFVDRDLASMGHVPGPLIFAIDNADLSRGLLDWMAGPRFSNSYGDAIHVPSVLVENHSLKPYRQRVLGTYVLLESCMRLLADQHDMILEAIQADQKARPTDVPLTWANPDLPPETVAFKGVSYKLETSPVTGGQVVRWLGKPEQMALPLIKMNKPGLVVSLPKAYWVPGQWRDVIDVLKLHGVEMTSIDHPVRTEVEVARFSDPVFDNRPFEGRVRVSSTYQLSTEERTFAPGSVRISTDQPLSELIALLLEPASPDSLFQWGFFNTVLQRTEYAEVYAMEPLATDMLKDKQLKAEWEEALNNDPELRVNPNARLDWFYARSSYFDREFCLYPVGREL
ncbi:MAG: M14 family metallopeptidase [Acidobacteria bacterium]|nr:M14 family metallopeptidase [Acidobacteriota bacterium]